MSTVILKLNGIFNMSFGKTFLLVSLKIAVILFMVNQNGIFFINDVYFNTIEFENENLSLAKSEIETKNRSFSYNGFFDKEQLDFKSQHIILKLKEN